MVKEDEIRLIAYNIWEQDDCPNEKDWEHWFRAESIWEQQHKPQEVVMNTKTKEVTLEPNRIKSKRKKRY